MKTKQAYNGYELGPIRPPSEADSLILRVTRNCSWNRCKFCSLYKGERFSLRPVEHVIEDIDRVKRYVDLIAECSSNTGKREVQQIARELSAQNQHDPLALQSAISWIRGGLQSVFLQDANTLIVKPAHLVEILNHIRKTFPDTQRITSYARSKTILNIKASDMKRLADAGLNRIHIGMESGSNRVLKLVDKGIDKEGHIVAGRRVKQAGIELSEYYMPGLGGAEFSRENALETADALNQIDPDFIRIRTLAVAQQIELYSEVQAGRFKQLGDRETAEELLLFIEHLRGVCSSLKSDHILNLLQDVEGRLPEERELMTKPIKKFLAMPENEQLLFMVGRRAGIFMRLDDMADAYLLSHAEAAVAANSVTMDNVDEFTATMMRRFI